MKTRQQLVDAGRVWMVYAKDAPENVLHECGSKTACLRWIKEQNRWREYKANRLRIAKLIWEAETFN